MKYLRSILERSCSFIAACAQFTAVAATTTTPPSEADIHSASGGYGFIINQGQVLDQERRQNLDVRFLHPGPQFSVALKDAGYSYEFFRFEGRTDAAWEQRSLGFGDAPDIRIRSHRVDVVYKGALGKATWSTGERAGDHLNFINEHGSFEKVGHFPEVTATGIYPGVSFRSTVSPEGGFKQDIICSSPEALHNIRFELQGATSTLLEDRTIEVRAADLTFQEEIPASYILRKNGRNEPVEVTYVQLADGSFGFEAKGAEGWAWNDGDRLVVDPTPNRLRASYYGGNGFDQFWDVLGGEFMVGSTSTNNAALASAPPAWDNTYNGGASDALIVKMNGTCGRDWATFYGGGGSEQCYRVDYESTGSLANIVVSGETNSSGVFGTAGVYQPALSGATQDGFVAKFVAATGARVWSTYFGGSGSDDARGLDVDGSGNVYIAGRTAGGLSANVHQTTYGGGVYDGYWAELNPTATSLTYCSYYGGSDEDWATGIALDGSIIYVCGAAKSTTGIGTAGTFRPTCGGSYDGFLAKFNSSGARSWGTYCGGVNSDMAFDVAIVACSSPVIVGGTGSTTNIASAGSFQPTFGGGPDDGFIIRFNPSTGTRIFGTYYGGINSDGLSAVHASGTDVLYVAGNTNSPSDPVLMEIATAGSWQPSLPSTYVMDGYFAKFSVTGARQWGSYYGGTDIDHIAGLSGVTGGAGIAIAGDTYSANTGNCIASCYNTTNSGGVDAFFAVFDGPYAGACQHPGFSVGTNKVWSVELYPVPFSSQFTLTAETPEDGSAELTLTDLTGRIVLQRTLGKMTEGRNSWSVDARDLSDGMYTWHLRAGDHVESGSIMRTGQ